MIITSNELEYSITIPTSKSYANRALILATLKCEKIILRNLPKSQDVKNMLNVLLKLGIINSIAMDYLEIEKSFPANEKKMNDLEILDLGEGGTTIRFLLVLLALGRNKYLIKVNPNFKRRPYKNLLCILKSVGARVELLESENELCSIQGPIHLESIEIDSLQTTQNVSAFLLLQSILDFDIQVTNLSSSHSYIDMTKSLVNTFSTIKEYTIPVDISSASYYIALASVSQNIIIKNLTAQDPLQADSEIFKTLDQIGVHYIFTEKGLEIHKCEKKNPFDIDVSLCLDLAPTLAFLASFCSGKSTLRNIVNLKFKESDRISSIIYVLKAFGVRHELGENILIIYGTESLRNPSELTVVDDHRIVMMASLFFKVLGGGEVHPASAVNKSFPEFFELLC